MIVNFATRHFEKTILREGDGGILHKFVRLVHHWRTWEYSWSIWTGEKVQLKFE